MATYQYQQFSFRSVCDFFVKFILYCLEYWFHHVETHLMLSVFKVISLSILFIISIIFSFHYDTKLEMFFFSD